ncbi:hypothetical protein ABFS82_08G139100 [Erythranthe guttata]|uniref:Diacylglycerol O-acyltransferase 3, cytosolic n=1 Tax=Erythranthe guttata TaxID=4155 RepID=A0A022RTM9_ERYGU|nr:PREDICTED: uncharacterized protein LOC105951443 [Erythranthe guttata]EYU43361.1 hypothetical protein MIMGU_mgv1a008579mg [Erythranthe guttata]|eukprot:XP_012830328.1 PREDICTED: uncharacterized protein LOC105951443 [Erythranthe guttata]
MDGAAVFLRQPIGLSSSGYSAAAAPPPSSKTSSAFVAMRRGEILSSGFCDQGHLQYYYNSCNNVGPTSSSSSSSRMSVKQEKEKSAKKMKKKQLKLLKGLSRDLSNFSQIGFGLDSDGLIDQVKGKTLSEAAELLMVELQKIKANKKELKRKAKEEKARLKASQIKNNFVDCEMSSSSSSSESSSSDGECGEVVNMKTLKSAQSKQDSPQQVIEEPTPTPITQTVAPLVAPLDAIVAEAIGVSVEERESSSVVSVEEGESSSVLAASSKKIEVCLGGKCKKSGGAALLEKFQSTVGIEGAVTGCKCMGKCREGPVVKVCGAGVADNNSAVKVAAAANSLCMGVGLEDVDMIVANLLGQSANHLGLVGAS